MGTQIALVAIAALQSFTAIAVAWLAGHQARTRRELLEYNGTVTDKLDEIAVEVSAVRPPPQTASTTAP